MIDIRQTVPADWAATDARAVPAASVAQLFTARIQGFLGERMVISADRGVRLLPAGGAPLFFLPPSAVIRRHLRPSDTLRIGDYGIAVHLHLAAGGRLARDAVWYHPGPDPEFAIIAGMVCIDPARLDRLTVDDMPVGAGPVPGGWHFLPPQEEPRRAG